MKLLVGTHNAGKAEEMAFCLGHPDLEILAARDVEGLMSPEEDGTTYLENARIKAKAYAEATGWPCLAEDSGLEVFHLDGRPGLYSARYAGASASNSERIERVLSELSGVASQDRGARFVCVAVLWVPGLGMWSSRGACYGEILTRSAGNRGFGYDPVFYLPSLKKTMAELSLEEKCRLSHRAEAIRRLQGPVSRLAALVTLGRGGSSGQG